MQIIAPYSNDHIWGTNQQNIVAISDEEIVLTDPDLKMVTLEFGPGSSIKNLEMMIDTNTCYRLYTFFSTHGGFGITVNETMGNTVVLDLQHLSNDFNITEIESPIIPTHANIGIDLFDRMQAFLKTLNSPHEPLQLNLYCAYWKSNITTTLKAKLKFEYGHAVPIPSTTMNFDKKILNDPDYKRFYKGYVRQFSELFQNMYGESESSVYVKKPDYVVSPTLHSNIFINLQSAFINYLYLFVFRWVKNTIHIIINIIIIII